MAASRALEENRKHYDAVYRPRAPVAHLLRACSSYDQQSKTRLNLRSLAPHLAELARTRRVARVLDYGCGWGTLLLGLRDRRYELYGYDLVDSAVANLARTMRALGVPFARAEVSAAGAILPGAFDVIVISHVLEHVDDDRALLRSLVAALDPGGVLLANVPINEVVSDPKHARAYDPRSLRALLEDAGLELRSVEELDRWSAWILEQEQDGSRGRRWLCKGLRGVLALTPLSWVEATEGWLLPDRPLQQLVALAVKKR